MLDDAFTNLESKIQTAELGIAQLKVLHDSQSMQIVIEHVGEGTHLAIESLFAGMAEWRMSNVVN